MSKKNQDNINLNFLKIEKSQNKNSKIRNNILKNIRDIKQKQNKNWTFKKNIDLLKEYSKFMILGSSHSGNCWRL
jgi:hypothetical protein